MRGEHNLPSASGATVAGSSPHARGTPPSFTRKHEQRGIIPACAGNTCRRNREPPNTWDHPRMRGEHGYVEGIELCEAGSSPHARGTPPRCARSRPCTWDHPRMRGEHKFTPSSPRKPMGSSPHARGTQRRTERLRRVYGIIPACAGNTRPCVTAGPRCGDHPRMRGEHKLSRKRTPTGKGSSPHARGTQPHPLQRHVRKGIIPACAGNTGSSPRRPRRAGDHPRMRGEHARASSKAARFMGSSPHARGTRRTTVLPGSPVGVIPACAGNTCYRNLIYLLPWDHPRMRGEHSCSSHWTVVSSGSSPHARGTQGRVIAEYSAVGIIPACAGNTCRCFRTASRKWDHPRMRGEHLAVECAHR